MYSIPAPHLHLGFAPPAPRGTASSTRRGEFQLSALNDKRESSGSYRKSEIESEESV